MKSRPGLLAAYLAVGLVTWPFVAQWFWPERASVPAPRVAWLVGPPPAFALRRTVCDHPGCGGFSRAHELKGNNREIFATGLFTCNAGPIWRVDIEITQGNAVAEGHDEGVCSGELGTWEAPAVALGPASFAPGPASGCGRFILRVGGEVTSTFEWCDDFTLARGRGLAGGAG